MAAMMGRSTRTYQDFQNGPTSLLLDRIGRAGSTAPALRSSRAPVQSGLHRLQGEKEIPRYDLKIVCWH
jgi:hypothetical protein